MSFLKFISEVGTEVLKVATTISRDETIFKINREGSRVLAAVEHYRRDAPFNAALRYSDIYSIKSTFTDLVGLANRSGATDADVRKAAVDLEYNLNRYAREIEIMDDHYNLQMN